MNFRLTASIAALAFALVASPLYAQCDGLPGCVLVWSDEFEGNTVDTSKWEFQTGDGSAYGIPGWGNNELQWYQSSNATVANGWLTIRARQESVSGHSYTSARLRSLGLAEFLYGRFEMRARLPVGHGIWPAFWMLPSDTTTYGNWAASGEIDIMESIGTDQIYGTIHYGGSSPANVYSGSNTYLPTGSASSSFHTYAVEWEPDEIRWYVDNQLYGTKSSWYSTAGPFPAPFDVNFHLLLNLAVGGNFPGNPDGSTVFPQDYVVDYVRVYQQPPPQADRAARCGSAKAKAAAKYAKCASALDASAVRDHSSVDSQRHAKCADKLARSFSRAESSAVGSCQTAGDAAVIQSSLDACLDSTVTSLGGIPGPGGSVASCQAGKVKASGKYLDCRLNVSSKALRTEVAGDFTRCVGKFSTSWTKLEGNSPSSCSTSGDGGSIQSAVEACHASILGDLTPPRCGDGVIGDGEECDDGNIASGDGCSSQCQLQPEYEQTFESLSQSSGAALADDGWKIFANVFNGASGAYLYGYGVFSAPNGGNAFCAISTGQGGAGQGSQQLVIYSDYNNGDHANGHWIDAIVFRERTLVAADVGKTFELFFDAKRGGLAGASTALAFVKTLDPNNGYTTTHFGSQSTTSIPTTWARYSVTLAVDAGMVGQILQYGFSSRATHYEPTDVYYDNIDLMRRATP